MIQLYNFTTLDVSEKELILSWRNHPTVRKWMINDNEISLEEHLHFIDLLATKTNSRYILVQNESQYIGVINLTHIHNNSAELGIYANPDMRGVGSVLMTALIDYASTLGISHLVANVFITNVRDQKLYQKFEFTEIRRIESNKKKMMTLERKL